MQTKAVESDQKSASRTLTPVSLVDVHWRRQSFAGSFRRGFSLLRLGWWLLTLTIRVLVSEVHSLPQRIEFRIARRLDRIGVDFGTAYLRLSNGHLMPNTRTHARIRDTQYMLARFPWATAVDLEVFLVGWDRGAEWVMAAKNNPCTQPKG